MAVTARYLADESALARFRIPAVANRLKPMIQEGDIATCAIVDLEVLYSSRNLVDYEEILEERMSLDTAPITHEVMGAAIAIQHELARQGHHRVPIAELIISAAARRADLVVLHYDLDLERIADAGGADHEWVVPRGTI